MSEQNTAIHRLVVDAIDQAKPLTVKHIRELRADNRNKILLYKSVFWVGVVIFNLALWVPLPFAVSKNILYLVAFVAIVTALIVPILGLKKPQLHLELLKVNRDKPKKKTVTDKGRTYIDLVKKLDRPLIQAEFELLDGSKWADKSEDHSS